jgi:hypothetical protein
VGRFAGLAMAPDDSSGPRPAAPIVLRIKLRYDDVEAMLQRFATNVGKSGLFLPTRSIQPIGAEIKFELRLADDTPALVGLGRVKAATPPDPDHPKVAFGMAIELMRVTPQSRALILRMLERRRAMGLPELNLPTAADIDAARRLEAGAGPASGQAPAVAGPTPPVAIDLAGEALLTAPRRATGPMTVASVLAVAPLLPEPARKKRVAMNELIESASGAIARGPVALPGLDDDVDVASALARARALAGGAGGALDAELEALAEAAAAPLEISIDAASAELARQLGGSAVRRDRSARWAPPPATLPAPSAEESPAIAVEIAAASASGPEVALAAAPPAGPPTLEVAPAAAAPVPPPTLEVAPGQSVDEIARDEISPAEVRDQIRGIDELDLDDAEHTELRDMPVAPDEARGGIVEPVRGDHMMLEARLEAELAEAEAEAEVQGLAAAIEEIDDFEILAEADADDEDLLAAHGEQDASDSRKRHAAPPGGRAPSELEYTQPPGGARPSSSFDYAAPIDQRPASELDFAARLDLGEDRDDGARATEDVLEALHDEVASPARRRDPLLDSAGQALAAFETGNDELAELADQLDDQLADQLDDQLADQLDDQLADELADRFDDPSDDGFDDAFDAAFDDSDVPGPEPLFGPESTGSFTLAGIPSDSLDLDTPSPPAPAILSEAFGGGRADRGQHAAAPGAPAVLRASPSPSPLPSLYGRAEEDELEHALEALDVDLDDLSQPRAGGGGPGAMTAPAPTPKHTPAPSRTMMPASAPSRTAAPAPARTSAPAPRASVPMPSRAPAATPSRASVPMPSRAPAATPARASVPMPSRVARASAAPAAPESTAPGAGRPRAPRVTTEDGVVIDFDDDE